MVNAFVVDNFHPRPYELREFALKQDFNVDGNYPGRRTRSFLKDSDYPTGLIPFPPPPDYTSTMQQKIADIVRPFAGEITWWGDEEYTGAFQYTTAKDKSWIHVDHITSWAAVLYLTPNAPITAGTGLFRHKLTGWTTEPYFDNGNVNENLKDLIYEDAHDMTKWEIHTMVGNVFNRLVLYKANQWHQSLDYFGKDIHDGRLFMTFFFNTEI
jgi:hypothetical protein